MGPGRHHQLGHRLWEEVSGDVVMENVTMSRVAATVPGSTPESLSLGTGY